MNKRDFELGDEIWFFDTSFTCLKPKKAKVIAIIKKIESKFKGEIEIYSLTVHDGTRSYDLEETRWCIFEHTKEELKEELLKRFDE